MKQMFGRIIMLLGLAVLLLPAGALRAAEGKTALAELHKAKQIGCADCHGTAKKITVDDSEKGINQSCVGCHGDLEAVGAKAKGPINPHKSHLGQPNCTACHSGHSRSQAYCLKCHSYDMPIPGGAAAAVPLKLKKSARKAESTDVVVIGAGAAGMTAAITAHDAGAKVILLEKQPITGGNSMLAAGGMNAAETKFQNTKGIKDSVELMYQDTMKGGKNMGDPALVRILAQNSSGSVDWLTSIGADISDVGRMGGASVNRTHRPTGGHAVGAHIANVLRKNAADRKIDIRVNSKVVKIIEDKQGRVTGVVVEGKHSGSYTIKAKAVVLTAGGFSANPEKVAFYRPEFKGMTTSNQPGATGDGLELGEKAGAELKDMKEIQIHPTVAAGSRILITEAVRGNGAILVNHEGKRFVNELTTRDKASAAILQQTGKSAYLVFDEGVRKSLKQIDGYFHLELVKEGATIKDLAAALKMPAATLEATIDTYNKAVDAKNDSEFKRPDMPRALRTAKYYAIEIKPGVHYTMGGLKINTDTQVIAKDGKPIAGFYAAGEVTGGVHGANRLGGNSISETITFGRIAGANAAKLVQPATK
ncbi:flavocytochrome c [Trichlorobacter lovleyi]|uniref:Fumarate reductase n=2 Tax=Trichlorobacter lovleyi TaxID=313985 RepID=B3E2Y2_TRIL1|nr:flavocytochrome c [Trichlorobacter lovleyi]ACD97242.1 flavocytochrome c [Trichlorobacter lovleyi SZ]